MTSKPAWIALAGALLLAGPAQAGPTTVSPGVHTAVGSAFDGPARVAIAELAQAGQGGTPALIEAEASGDTAGGAVSGQPSPSSRGLHIALNGASWLLGLAALGLSRVSQRRAAWAWKRPAPLIAIVN